MEYRLAQCCAPAAGDDIVGFLKQDADIFSVHRADCPNLNKVPMDRLVILNWDDIRAAGQTGSLPLPPELVAQLDSVDYAILAHHQEMGVDYAAVVACSTGIARAEVFVRHRKLRDLGLLERVEPRIIRYRKGIVDGKWIKHRNHTYYDLTALGRQTIDRR
jgi:hypothetical protein